MTKIIKNKMLQIFAITFIAFFAMAGMTFAATQPGVPDMTAGTDTGASNTDNITKNQTPNFDISCTGSDVVFLYVDGSKDTHGTCSSGSITLSPSTNLDEGNRLIAATAADDVAGTSETSQSNVLVITVDITAPGAPTGLDLNVADDTGSSNSDNITQNTSALTITGSAEANMRVDLFDGATSLSWTSANGTGDWTKDISLAEGSHNITAKTTDVAGNTGIASTALTITVDTTAPIIQSSTSQNTEENTTLVGDGSFMSNESNVTFSKVGGADSTKFSITSGGVLNFGNAPDYENPTDQGGQPGDNTYIVTIRTTDLAGNFSDTDISATVTNENDNAPVLSGVDGGIVTYTEGGVHTVLDINPALSDPDNSGNDPIDNISSATVLIQNCQSSEDVLEFTDIANITGSWTAGTCTLALTGVDTLANYETALGSITYYNSSEDPDTTDRTINWTVNDGAFSSSPVSSTINVIAVNDKPELSGIGANLSYTENAGAVVIDSSIDVTDVDDVNMQSAQIFILNYKSGEDILDATNFGTFISKFWDSNNGVLTLIGNDTKNNYKTVLESVTYENISDNPNTTSRQINWEINDGTLNSSQVNSAITITAVSDAPVITSFAGLMNVSFDRDENTTAVTTVTATDPDGTVTYSITGGTDAALFQVDSSNGELTFITAPDFENPTDADTNNTYLVTVKASDGALSDIQRFTVTVIDVNETTLSDAILSQIGNEADDPDVVNSVVTISQLNDILPVLSNVISGNETAYQDYIDANPSSFSSPATQAEVQAMVDAVNSIQSALEKIKAYAENSSNPAPTVEDYVNVGVIGVNADNLNRVNAEVDAVTENEVDTLIKIQALVTGLLGGSGISTETPIFRLYNKKTGVHLYTRGEADRDKILTKWDDFEFTDGAPAFYASLIDDGTTPIYRLYNKRTGAQLYTRGVSDRDKILNKYHDFEFTDGAPAFYASLIDDGNTPIYRLYNTRTGMQLYTRGIADKDKILNKYHNFEFTDEVPAFYAQTN